MPRECPVNGSICNKLGNDTTQNGSICRSCEHHDYRKIKSNLEICPVDYGIACDRLGRGGTCEDNCYTQSGGKSCMNI